MKLFCCSDIHSAYTPWMKALEEAGFDKNNEDHKIILCGDLFDRMDESLQVYYFVMEMLNNDKIIYVKGNHESLLLDCIKRRYPYDHDYSNGTFKTILDLAPHAKTFPDACDVVYEKVKPLFDKTVNYFETKQFVFVHGFLPVNCDDGLPAYYRRNRKFSKMENWREAHQSQWNDAMWLNSFDMIEQGFGIEKCIVAGHWHSSYGRYKIENKPEFGDGADFSPFYYQDKLIMIDACTAHSHKVNCLVLEDVFMDG